MTLTFVAGFLQQRLAAFFAGSLAFCLLQPQVRFALLRLLLPLLCCTNPAAAAAAAKMLALLLQ